MSVRLYHTGALLESEWHADIENIHIAVVVRNISKSTAAAVDCQLKLTVPPGSFFLKSAPSVSQSPTSGKYYWACHDGVTLRFTRACDCILALFGTLLSVCLPEPWCRHICACICWSPLSTPPFFDIKTLNNEHCCCYPGAIVCLHVLLSGSATRLGYGAPASHHPILEFRQSSFRHRFAYHAIVNEPACATFICKRCVVVALLIFSFLNILLNFLQSSLCFSFTSI